MAGKRKKHGGGSLHVGPNMTPMVDIVMCILIFFMLGMSFNTPDLFLTSQAAVDKGGIGTPDANQKMPTTRFTIKLDTIGSATTVNLPGAGQVSLPAVKDSMAPSDREDALKGRTDAIAGMLDVLKRKKQAVNDDVQVVISPANGVPFQDVITAYDNCMGAGFSHVAFATTR